MNTKQLRQKILDLAIKGKLVPQDPNDEPASKLLERIREEKEQLIKEGKLKRDKNESYIFVGDDKLHYEKFADGSVVCIEDEIPFEIPDSWAWARGKEIFKGLSSTKPSNDFFKYIDIDAIDNKLHIVKAPKQIATKDAPSRASRYLEFGDTLFSMVRPYLENIAYISDELKDCIASTGFYVCSPYRNLNSEFIYHLMLSKYVISGLNSFMKGDNSPSINASDIEDFLYPIPPINEQQRITQTIKELLSLVETLANDKVNLSELIKKTKAKVLDLAIKGMLVPQDPNDEPADKLLEKIREEKEKLIKEGKLKRDKNETYIFKNSDDNSYYEQIDGETICIDDDLPFEIPDSWRWTKFANICEIARGGSPRPIEAYLTNAENGINWIKIGDTEKGGKYIYSTKEKIKPEGISKSRYVKAGDFLLTNSMSFGRPYILKTDGCIHDGWLVINDDFKVFDQNFLYYLLSSNVMYQLLSIAAQGSTVKNLKSDTVKNVIIPIPPKREQSQIASRIASIFSQLDTMQEIFLQ